MEFAGRGRRAAAPDWRQAKQNAPSGSSRHLCIAWRARVRSAQRTLPAIDAIAPCCRMLPRKARNQCVRSVSQPSQISEKIELSFRPIMGAMENLRPSWIILSRLIARSVQWEYRTGRTLASATQKRRPMSNSVRQLRNRDKPNQAESAQQEGLYDEDGHWT